MVQCPARTHLIVRCAVRAPSSLCYTQVLLATQTSSSCFCRMELQLCAAPNPNPNHCAKPSVLPLFCSSASTSLRPPLCAASASAAIFCFAFSAAAVCCCCLLLACYCLLLCCCCLLPFCGCFYQSTTAVSILLPLYSGQSRLHSQPGMASHHRLHFPRIRACVEYYCTTSNCLIHCMMAVVWRC